MISFGLQYWFVFLLAAILSAGLTALTLYFRNKETAALPRFQVWFLSVLRFLSFFIVAFLLLSPFFKNLKKIVRNPIIVTAWDNSASIKSTPDSLQISEELLRTRKLLHDELSKSYSVVEYSFGESSSVLGELNFSEKKSDYSDIISTISNQHFNENVGAVIIAGDGIYNQGRNPVNLISEVNFPVYTIGFGDTTEVMDSKLRDIRVNRTSFSGNKFPVEIDVQFSKLSGTPLKLSIFQDQEELASTVITPPNQNYFTTQEFILEAGSPDLKHYSAKIETVENERNIKNNTAGFVINVLENKQKILIVSDGPHPDIGAIKNTLDEQKTYDISVFTEDPYPSNLSEFNLLILNQLPTSGKSAAEILKNAASNRLPVLLMVGTKTFLPQFNSLAMGAQILPLAGSGEEAQATFNPFYATFTLSENFKEVLVKFPPLLVPFADFELAAGFTPLFYQKIMNIETAKPLMATGVLSGRKTGYIFGEGIWRWRLFDYLQNGSHANFNELVNQLVQYLALRENEDNFIVNFNAVYSEIEDVTLTAEVYNDAFERITTEEVNIKIENSEGKEYSFTFDVRGEHYQLNTGHLPTGDYTFLANVSVGDESYDETGRFTVTPVNFENVVTQANHNVLFQLAAQSGGKFYLPQESGRLIEDLVNGQQLKSTSYFQEMIRELLNLKVLFFVVLLLLSVEWFLRKFWGIY